MLVCYCFQYSQEDIEEDFKKNAKSTILAEILALKKENNCDCQNKHPQAR